MKSVLDQLLLDDLSYPHVSDAFPSKYWGRNVVLKSK